MTEFMCLSLLFRTHGEVAHVCNLRTEEIKTGRFGGLLAATLISALQFIGRRCS